MNTLFNSFSYILNFYYGDVAKETIVSFGLKDEEEFDVEAVFEVCSRTNLSASYEDINFEALDSFLAPAILFDKNSSIVILKSISYFSAIIVEDGVEKEIKNSALKKYKKALFFFRDEKDKRLTSRKKPLDWFFKPIKSMYKAYIEVGIISFFINIFALALPLFTMNVYDRVVPNFAIETLIVLVVGVLIIFSFDLILKSVRVHILEDTSRKLSSHFEQILLDQIMSKRSNYDHLLSGTKANLFKELQSVKEFFSSRTLIQVLDLPFFIIAVGVIYVISPTIAVIPLVTGFLMIAFNFLMQFPLATLSHRQFKEAQSKNGYLLESISGSDTLKLQNSSGKRGFMYVRMVEFYEKLANKISTLNHLTQNITYILIQSITLAVVFVGVFEIHNQALSIGGLIAVTILSSRAMVPIVSLSNVILQYKRMKESLLSINEYWYIPREVDETTSLGLNTLHGDIEFKDVEFIYKDAKYPSLSGFNLKIKAGEKVGIIGQTGAGKSTILRLISLLDTPTSGSLYIDNHETSTIHPHELRSHLGVMPQDAYLFYGSIKDNIALDKNINKEEYSKLISLTGLDELIKKSGVGDELNVGENGSNLSQGQKNLVSLARALASNPSVLVLDEPTTGLDISLEQSVVQKLKPIVEDKTLILITHRFSALDLVDRVVVVDNGKVVADGEKSKVLNALKGQN